MGDAEKVELCVQFRSESEFKTQLEAAEGDGPPTYTRWMLWKAPVQTSGDRPASPRQTAVSTSVTITDPSDTSHERPASMPIGARHSTPDAGKEVPRPVVMFSALSGRGGAGRSHSRRPPLER